MSINYPAQHYICYTHTLEDTLSSIYTTQHSISVTTRSEFLTQKHGMIVMKVKVEDLEGLGGSLNIQEYLLLLC